ncbi:response regulator [Azospirillum thermophilum]|nr:response regulator [Azospirillum thermophilum]
MGKDCGPQEQRKTILVVDDEPDVLGVVAADLRYAGFEVLCARGGDEAMALLRTHPVQVVVCDILMPGMSGLDLLRAVRALGPGRAAVPFIFLSALDSREDVIAARRLGADGYLTKPVDFDLLTATVESHLAAVERIAVAERAAADAVENRLKERLPPDALAALRLALAEAFTRAADGTAPTSPALVDDAPVSAAVPGGDPVHVSLLAPRRGKWERLSLTYLMHLADAMAEEDGIDVSIESDGVRVYTSKPHDHEIELF